MSAKALLARAEKDIGLGEPNYLQTNYEILVGYDLGSNWAWCDAAVSVWATESFNGPFVCPKGPRAWTVLHAKDGRDIVGTWYKGTAENIKEYAVPGAIIFFDWAGTDTIDKIDHVGVIEFNLGDSRVATIEGNSSNVCARRVRGASVVAGFFIPRYPVQPPKPMPKPPVPLKNKLIIPDGSPTLKPGSTGKDVHDLQLCLNRINGSKLVADGIFGKLTTRQVNLFKGKNGLDKNGIYGPLAAAKLKTAVKAS